VNNKSQPTNDLPDVASHDQLRSRHLQRLLRKRNSVTIFGLDTVIPHTLIQYWDQAEVPSDVQRCLESWRALDDLGFERLLYDRVSARSFIKDRLGDLHLQAFDTCNHPAMRSDYFRLCYLSCNGGVYVDADDELVEPEAVTLLVEAGILQLQPLCYQRSSDSMVVPVEYADVNDDDFLFYVANDPILAPANNPVIEEALHQATARLIEANGSSRDIQWLTGPGNLSEALVRHSISRETSELDQDFRFVTSWVQIAPGDWTLEYRNDARNWRLWTSGGSSQ
jgi:mannosyltransferase OCH1-like enzyme